MTGIGRLAVTLEKATDKSSSSNDHHSRRTPVRFKFRHAGLNVWQYRRTYGI
jgi:hypothetical protein